MKQKKGVLSTVAIVILWIIFLIIGIRIIYFIIKFITG
jgi:hypothetical protein